MEVDAPLKSPAWDAEEEAVLALRQDEPRLVKTDVTDSGPLRFFQPPQVATVSRELEGAGENLALDLLQPDNVFVPQPRLDRVAAIKHGLVNLRAIEVGDSPARIAVSNGDALAQREKTLFALSADGSTVTGVNLETHEVVVRVSVGRGGEALIEASEKGNPRQFWIAGPQGVAFYGSPPRLSSQNGAVGLRANSPLGASALAVNDGESRKAYVADAETGRVVALQPAGTNGELEVTAAAHPEGKVKHLAVEDGRLYAATSGELLVLDAGDLDLLKAVSFGEALQEDVIADAEPSGIAVGEENVYLTLENAPYLVRIAKP